MTNVSATASHLAHLLDLQGQIEVVEEEDYIMAFINDPDGKMTVKQSVQLGGIITGFLRGNRQIARTYDVPSAHGWACGRVYMAWRKMP